MLTRLTHAAIAFAVTAVLYQAYVLAVAPFVEPPPMNPLAQIPTANLSSAGASEAIAKNSDLLSAYFPPTHWCFARPPKMIESQDRRLLAIFDNYVQSPNGLVAVPKFAVLFFPSAPAPGQEPPRDALIMEAAEGADIYFGAGDVAAMGFEQFSRAVLKGEITVRSDMHEPGPQDDLLLKTRQITINEDRLIRTDETVDLRIGEHHAFGRVLELQLLKTEGTSATPIGLFGQLEDLKIKHEVELLISPGKLRFSSELRPTGGQDSLTAGTAQNHRESSAAKASPPLTAPPIRIMCDGEFRIDFGGYKATFSDNVRAWQKQPGGSLDELHARELALYFTKTTEWNGDGATPTGGGMSFEPASIEALGESGKPVVLTAPSYQARARGERLWIDLLNRHIHRVRLEGGEDAMISHNGAELQSNWMEYTLPRPGSAERIGTLKAKGGRLQAAPDPARPYEIFEVKWKSALNLIRRNGRLVLVLDGRPNISMTGAGRLWADRLQLFLKEQAPPPETAQAAALASPAANAGSLSSSLVPELLTASGNVAIESPELTGEVNQLDVKIEQLTAAAPSGVSGAVNRPAAAATPAAAASSLAPSGYLPGGGSRRYNVTGVELKVDVALRDRQTAVRGLRVDGNVIFQEMSPPQQTEPPLQILAEHLVVTGADGPNARIEIDGGGGQNGVARQLAEISAHGATLRAPLLTINRGSNEAWINSPGQLQLLVDRDMAGNPLPQPTPLDVTWQESMKLEGRRITFLGEVFVQHESGWLRTRRMVLQTTGPVAFDGAAGNGRPQLEQLECWEGAVAEFQQQDISGVSSRQHIELQSLIVNQVTGAVGGSGPGTIDSVHLAKSAGQNFALPLGGGPQAPGLVQNNNKQELRHLHIEFIRGVEGNLHQRTIGVLGDVRTVYGPVQSWDDRLSMTPGGSPGRDEVWITCEKLNVTESPLARLNPQAPRQVELMAETKVTIEGQVPGQGAFTAYGHRAKYDQSKGNMILEGNGTTPATIEQQAFPGAPRSPQTAQRMTFNHITGYVKIEGIQQGQINQFQPK